MKKTYEENFPSIPSVNSAFQDYTAFQDLEDAYDVERKPRLSCKKSWRIIVHSGAYPVNIVYHALTTILYPIPLNWYMYIRSGRTPQFETPLSNVRVSGRSLKKTLTKKMLRKMFPDGRRFVNFLSLKSMETFSKEFYVSINRMVIEWKAIRAEYATTKKVFRLSKETCLKNFDTDPLPVFSGRVKQSIDIHDKLIEQLQIRWKKALKKFGC